MLVEAARRHPDGYVRFRALVLLSGFNDPKTAGVFLDALGDENDCLREWTPSSRTTRNRRSCRGFSRRSKLGEQAEFVRPALYPGHRRPREGSEGAGRFEARGHARANSRSAW